MRDRLHGQSSSTDSIGCKTHVSKNIHAPSVSNMFSENAHFIKKTIGCGDDAIKKKKNVVVHATNGMNIKDNCKTLNDMTEHHTENKKAVSNYTRHSHTKRAAQEKSFTKSLDNCLSDSIKYPISVSSDDISKKKSLLVKNKVSPPINNVSSFHLKDSSVQNERQCPLVSTTTGSLDRDDGGSSTDEDTDAKYSLENPSFYSSIHETRQTTAPMCQNHRLQDLNKSIKQEGIGCKQPLVDPQLPCDPSYKKSDTSHYKTVSKSLCDNSHHRVQIPEECNKTLYSKGPYPDAYLNANLIHDIAPSIHIEQTSRVESSVKDIEVEPLYLVLLFVDNICIVEPTLQNVSFSFRLNWVSDSGRVTSPLLFFNGEQSDAYTTVSDKSERQIVSTENWCTYLEGSMSRRIPPHPVSTTYTSEKEQENTSPTGLIHLCLTYENTDENMALASFNLFEFGTSDVFHRFSIDLVTTSGLFAVATVFAACQRRWVKLSGQMFERQVDIRRPFVADFLDVDNDDQARFLQQFVTVEVDKARHFKQESTDSSNHSDHNNSITGDDDLETERFKLHRISEGLEEEHLNDSRYSNPTGIYHLQQSTQLIDNPKIISSITPIQESVSDTLSNICLEDHHSSLSSNNQKTVVNSVKEDNDLMSIQTNINEPLNKEDIHSNDIHHASSYPQIDKERPNTHHNIESSLVPTSSLNYCIQQHTLNTHQETIASSSVEHSLLLTQPLLHSQYTTSDKIQPEDNPIYPVIYSTVCEAAPPPPPENTRNTDNNKSLLKSSDTLFSICEELEQSTRELYHQQQNHLIHPIFPTSPQYTNKRLGLDSSKDVRHKTKDTLSNELLLLNKTIYLCFTLCQRVASSGSINAIESKQASNYLPILHDLLLKVQQIDQSSTHSLMTERHSLNAAIKHTEKTHVNDPLSHLSIDVAHPLSISTFQQELNQSMDTTPTTSIETTTYHPKTEQIHMTTEESNDPDDDRHQDRMQYNPSHRLHHLPINNQSSDIQQHDEHIRCASPEVLYPLTNCSYHHDFKRLDNEQDHDCHSTVYKEDKSMTHLTRRNSYALNRLTDETNENHSPECMRQTDHLISLKNQEHYVSSQYQPYAYQLARKESLYSSSSSASSSCDMNNPLNETPSEFPCHHSTSSEQYHDECHYDIDQCQLTNNNTIYDTTFDTTHTISNIEIECGHQSLSHELHKKKKSQCYNNLLTSSSVELGDKTRQPIHHKLYDHLNQLTQKPWNNDVSSHILYSKQTSYDIHQAQYSCNRGHQLLSITKNTTDHDISSHHSLTSSLSDSHHHYYHEEKESFSLDPTQNDLCPKLNFLTDPINELHDPIRQDSCSHRSCSSFHLIKNKKSTDVLKTDEHIDTINELNTVQGSNFIPSLIKSGDNECQRVISTTTNTGTISVGSQLYEPSQSRYPRCPPSPMKGFTRDFIPSFNLPLPLTQPSLSIHHELTKDDQSHKYPEKLFNGGGQTPITHSLSHNTIIRQPSCTIRSSPSCPNSPSIARYPLIDPPRPAPPLPTRHRRLPISPTSTGRNLGRCAHLPRLGGEDILSDNSSPVNSEIEK